MPCDNCDRLRAVLADEKRKARAIAKAIDAAQCEHCHRDFHPECSACHIVQAYWDAADLHAALAEQPPAEEREPCPTCNDTKVAQIGHDHGTPLRRVPAHRRGHPRRGEGEVRDE